MPKLTILDVLFSIGRYDTLVCVYDFEDKKKSGIMKVGNIPFKKLSHWLYKRRVYMIIPSVKQNKSVLFINLMKDDLL